MKKLSLQQKYLGSDWNFILDPSIPKSSHIDLNPIEAIDEKFYNIMIDTTRSAKTIDQKTNEQRLLKSQSSKILSQTKQPSKSHLRYRSPWYIAPKYWQQLAKIPEVPINQVERRAKNLYYFLHKAQPNANPLQKKGSKVSVHESQYTETREKLATLPIVHKYKR